MATTAANLGAMGGSIMSAAQQTRQWTAIFDGKKTRIMRSSLLVLALAALAAFAFFAYQHQKSVAQKNALHLDDQAVYASSREQRSIGGNRITSLRNISSTGKEPDRMNRLEVRNKFLADSECFWKKKEISNLENLIIECESTKDSTDKAIQTAYELCHEHTASLQQEIEGYKQDTASCVKVDNVYDSFYQAVSNSAKLGDPDAQFCYIQSMFGSTRKGDSNTLHHQYSENERHGYALDAPTYISQAFIRGDWRVVELLSNRPGRGNGLLTTIFQGDALTRYAMNRLLRLGAKNDYVRSLDDSANFDILSLSPNGEMPLSDSEVNYANKWAQATYDLYFKESPKLLSKPSTNCVQQ